MKTQKLLLSKVNLTGLIQKMNGFVAGIFCITAIAGCILISTTTLVGSELIKLKDGNLAITLSGGKVTTFTPPPVNTRGFVNLPGAHICLPVALETNPAAAAGGWFVVPTTGGNIAVINSMGMIIGTYDLPGDHVMEIKEFKPNGDFSVQTTGGLVSFFTANGTFLGTIDLPGDHGMKQILSPDGTQIAVVNQNNEIFILGKDPVTGQPVQIGNTVNCPGSPAYFEWGILVNLNNQVFDFDGNMLADFPGAFAFLDAGLLLNQNLQVFNLANPAAEPLDLPGSPAYPPIAVVSGNVLLINQNFQIFNVNPAGPGGKPKQNGQGLDLPGAPIKHPDPGQLIIPGGANFGNFLAVNQNGQIWIVNPGNNNVGPAVVGAPLNLPNSPLYVVQNGIPGVYVVASTGGHVDIIDARGPGKPVIVASFDHAGEHTGEPVMDKDANGNHFVHISTSSGLYTINKSTFVFEHKDQNQLGGQLVCCMGPVMPGAGMSGDDIPVMCDISMAGELEMASAFMTVRNPDNGEILALVESMEPPFMAGFQVPEYAMPGMAFAVDYEVFDPFFNPLGQGVGVLGVISPIRVEALKNEEALPGETVNPVFMVSNSGNEPVQLHMQISNEMGWSCNPEVLPLFLLPGDTSVITCESVVPSFLMPCSNRFNLEAVNIINPMLSGSDYLDVKVVPYTQQINLVSGWSGISTWLNPIPPDVESIFAPIGDDLVILMNMSDVYWPAQNINGIGTWNVEKGYKIKVNGDHSITVSGLPPNNRSLMLNPGWHIIPILSSVNVPVMNVLDVPGVILAKEIGGGNVFWPGMAIFTLDELESGKAYLVLINEPVTLNFAVKSTAVQPDQRTINLMSDAPWKTVQPTASSHIIALQESLAVHFSTGDYIGAFNTEGLNTGIARIGDRREALVVYGDDPLTPEIDGMLPGEEIRFRIWNADDKTENAVDVTFDISLPAYDGTFAEDGISAVDLLTPSGYGAMCMNINIYPNPVREYVNIKVDEPSGQSFMVKIINSSGMTVIDNITMSSGEFMADLSVVPDGCYLMVISSDKEIACRKIIVKK